MLALPPSDSPAGSRSAPPGTPAAEQSPGRPTSADGPEVLADTHRPTAAPLLRRPDRWRKQASAPEPLVGPPLTLDRPVRTWRTSPWRAGHAGSPSGRLLPPGCGRRTPAWTPSPLISSSCGHPAAAGRVTDMADLSSVRSAGHPPVHCDRLADGYGPVRTAAAKRRTPPASDHASGQLATANHAARTSWP
jgi:hypothetical protein